MAERFYFSDPGDKHLSGCLAKSLAGHDRGEIFVILQEEGEYLYLADGKYRTVGKPKKKKKKHVQLIYVRQENLSRKLKEKLPVYDAEIKTFIKCFKREN